MIAEITSDSNTSFLDETYKSLGYKEGILLDAVSNPNSQSSYKEAEAWLEKGDWLTLGNKVGAEKIFFVEDNPVFVFYQFEQAPNLHQQLNAYRRVWCMARPQCLFMAFPGELRVYSLNQPPSENVEEWQQLQPLQIVKNVADVAEKLKAYRREQVESGALFADARFGNINERADKRLIQDLRKLRNLLTNESSGLDLRYAHALIGRSIFIRYLEDREVLTPKYFEEVAERNPKWLALLSEHQSDIDLTPGAEARRYTQVLVDKDFTYALFDQLAKDFNGDIFPIDPNEKQKVGERHLKLLRGFLRGEITDSKQKKMFFSAYDFKIVPIDLISSIYEEFYHSQNIDTTGRNITGTHYTPSILVEHVLSNLLTKDRLAANPKILDPACGSGIFLVEAFRRIVRYRVQQQNGNLLSSEELGQIIRNQIFGIEINKEAIRVAAFSLYLALLNYLEPPDIRKNKSLPNLIYQDNFIEDQNHFQILFNFNAFDLMASERQRLREILKQKSKFEGRVKVEALANSSVTLPLTSNSFDIVVGNPPWGIDRFFESNNTDAKKQLEDWCEVNKWSIGNQEPSQAFIARSLTFLKPGGESGLLVSSGVLLKHQARSHKFRSRWLEETTIKTVVSFINVRHAFFSADAPFVFVHYQASHSSNNHFIYYWSAKKTKSLMQTQIVILGQTDFHAVRQYELENNSYLWKTYWWGGHRDAALISKLKLNKTLLQFKEEHSWGEFGRGYEGDTPKGNHLESDWLQDYKELPLEYFKRYIHLDPSILLPVPPFVNVRGLREIYSGWRLLVKRGFGSSESTGQNGTIEARIDNLTYCFTNSIHGINLHNTEDWERKILLAILWSSLTRYYLFLTVSSWGVWHYDLHLEEVKNIPIRFPRSEEQRSRIIQLVEKLQNIYRFGKVNRSELDKLEQQLDAAIFDLYDLIEPEYDLILDMCYFGLDFLYNQSRSIAANKVEKIPLKAQGYIEDLPSNRQEEKGLEGYLYAFLSSWNRELEPEGEFSWRIVRPEKAPMIVVIFSTQETGQPLPELTTDDEAEWDSVLTRCSEVLEQELSRQIYIDGIVRVVTETEIYIIKRDEARFWTRSAAREDAEATLLQTMKLQEMTRV